MLSLMTLLTGAAHGKRKCRDQVPVRNCVHASTPALLHGNSTFPLDSRPFVLSNNRRAFASVGRDDFLIECAVAS